ncbi:uncharacterized protein LOC134221705 [Armigeres subalbatus]|uniref:uncharacterized protein LOC134221705 n=1 Tax=Armigeres subalbatus TaxID=124917 RepID=UPI002ED27D07
MDDTYMDDVITGANDVETATQMQIQLNAMLSRGGFQLRKWASNCPAALAGIPEENLAIRTSDGINLDPDPAVKTLGLTWIPSSDILRFQFIIPSLDSDTVLTKRSVLSVIATLFDPLGLLGAAITTAKIFMQLLWIIRDKNEQPLNWDQPLPPMVGESWRRFHEQLPMLNQARIERCVIIPESVDVELHCFSDASEKAYGACLYVRSTDADGRVKVRLLSSKSKVAPLKCQTIPRLELCGAVLAAQLYEKVRTSIKTSANGYFWTDSTCVLRWLQAYPTTWTTFVANRTAKIQSITEGCRWSHVPGIQNPADLISRGIAPQDIIDNQFWWRGPTWLEESSDKWPRSLEPLTSGEEESEKRRTIIATTASSVSEFNQEYISKFSSYNDLIRRTAYWLRLMKLLRTPITSRNDVGFLTTSELRDAEGTLVRLVQKEVFAEELKAISSGRFVARRGLCTNIYSDNGTNFVGARNQLKDLLKLLKSNDHNSAVSKECAKVGIQWHFIPPSAPHFGGLWEAAVRSTKHHLLRVEACLNSRPLTPLSDDPNDLEPLTPAHFLIGTSLLSIPEPELDVTAQVQTIGSKAFPLFVYTNGSSKATSSSQYRRMLYANSGG